MRRAAKIDANQPQIVQLLRRLGCSVCVTSQVGGGFPDLVASISGVNVLVEVKDGSKPPSARRLTPEQVRFHEAWSGWIAVVSSESEVEALVAEMRERRRCFPGGAGDGEAGVDGGA